jgi:hypothetical protein
VRIPDSTFLQAVVTGNSFPTPTFMSWRSDACSIAARDATAGADRVRLVEDKVGWRGLKDL